MAGSFLARHELPLPPRNASELLARYVELHNDALYDEGDADILFHPEARIEVAGESLSELRKAAIVRDFRANELLLWQIAAAGSDVARASYAWRKNPRLGGEIWLERRGGSILLLTLRPCYSRLFETLASAPRPFSAAAPGPFGNDERPFPWV
jgi:hypothetical protein